MADDFTFLTQLIDQLTLDLPIDKNRIFVTGLQSGGHMAYTLACATPGRIASIASISGGMPLNERKASMRCSDNKRAPVSVMEMHGTAGSCIPYGGGGGLNAPPTLEVIKYWATADGCTGDPSVNQSGITKTTLWKHCGGTSAVRLDTVTGGHNTWFGSTLDPVPGGLGLFQQRAVNRPSSGSPRVPAFEGAKPASTVVPDANDIRRISNSSYPSEAWRTSVTGAFKSVAECEASRASLLNVRGFGKRVPLRCG